MLIAFTGMLKTGVSGNLMSLGAIDFGLLVDGSVVMIDNIIRKLGNLKDRSVEARAKGIHDAGKRSLAPHYVCHRYYYLSLSSHSDSHGG